MPYPDQLPVPPQPVETEHLVMAVQQSVDCIFLTDPQGRLSLANPAFLATTGHTALEALGQPLTVLLPDFPQPDPETPWRGRIWTRTRQNEPVQLEGTLTCVKDAQGQPASFAGLFRDVTQEEEADRRLVRGEKMDALGALASGVAHDFNNILTAILSASELIEWQVQADSPIMPKLHVIYQAVKRAQELNRQILSFSRSSEEKHLPFDLSAVVKEAIFLLRSTFPDTITLRTDITSSLWILGDPNQAHQVVLNLAINALQAMLPRGGTLEVTLAEEEEAQARLLPNQPRALKEGRYVVLSVKDTGSGIDPEHLERIFEPFFTTKAETGGTGLGLSVVHGIVQKHMGAMDVHSQKGHGTTFKAFFPIATHDLTVTEEETVQEHFGGQERILLVDDEEVLGALAKQGLQLLGYRVTARSDSKEALDEFQNRPRDFDLLITDLSMPGLSGVELTNRIRKLNPDLPAILVTGAFQGPPSMEGISTPFDDVIYKPVTIQEMAKSVRRVMAQRPAPRPQEARAPAPGGTGSGPTVLLAEDSNVTRVLLRTWLVKGGYKVVDCRDGLEAWEAFAKARNDGGIGLVLTDIIMPKMDGLQLAAKIREVDTNVPIVILSTSEDSDSVKEAIHLQVNEFLTKPFESAVLLDCVKRLSMSHDQHLKGLRSVETAQAVRMAQRAMEAVPEKDMPIFSISEPLTDAGGDVFRCHRIADGSIFFAIADVAGHSVISSYAVAAYLGMLSNFVGECRHLRPASDRDRDAIQSHQACVRFGTGHCQPLRHLALKLNRTIQTGPFSEVPICSLFGIWSPGTGRLHLLNAGIPHTRWYRRDRNTTIPVAINGAPLGILDDPPMEEKVIAMAPGDRLLLGSDGFFEVQGPEGEPFENILETLWRDLACTDILTAINLVSESARVHAEGRFTDDLLVVALEQPEFPASSPRFALTMPAEAAQIDRACHDLAHWLDQAGALASSSRRFETLLAVREALSNAMLHAHPVGQSPEVVLRGRLDPQGQLEVAVLDEGQGFDLEAHQPPDTASSERGRGIPLIRHFSSEVLMIGGELLMTFAPETGHSGSVLVDK